MYCVIIVVDNLIFNSHPSAPLSDHRRLLAPLPPAQGLLSPASGRAQGSMGDDLTTSQTRGRWASPHWRSLAYLLHLTRFGAAVITCCACSTNLGAGSHRRLLLSEDEPILVPSSYRGSKLTGLNVVPHSCC